MKYRLYCIAWAVAWILAAGATRGQARPAWVVSMGRELDFPAEQFLTGFGVSPEDKNMPMAEKMQYARNMAYRNLAASLQVEIKSEDQLNRLSVIANNNEDMVEEFKSTITAKSDINLDGVEFTEYTGKSNEPVYALAHLNRGETLAHYRVKFGTKLKYLEELQRQANERLAATKIAEARKLYLQCDQVVNDLESIILTRELLGDTAPAGEGVVSRLLQVKSKSRELWAREADTLQDAAEQLALKLAGYEIAAGRVQINAPMLDDSYQYSQFSSRFRGVLEEQVAAATKLRPLIAGEMDFTPHSAGVARNRLASNKADYLLAGSYFIHEDEGSLRLLMRLSSAESGEIVATASATLKLSGTAGIELKPRNYLQVLEDRRVFAKGEMVGGGLNLEVWTNHGIEGLLLEDGDEVNVFVRVNRPCYLRFIYHLCNGARIVPDTLYMNYFINSEQVNQVVKLPHDFSICAPFGSETMQFVASTETLPSLQIETRTFDGEPYDVLADSLAESNMRHRGIKASKKVEVAEQRIALTTVAK